MLTVDYAFYTSRYKGKTIEADFDRLSVKAAAYLDRVTDGRVESELEADLIDRAKLAHCGVVDALLLNENGGGIASESNDGVSISYVAETKSDAQRLYEPVTLFLSGTDLLYRGVR